MKRSQNTARQVIGYLNTRLQYFAFFCKFDVWKRLLYEVVRFRIKVSSTLTHFYTYIQGLRKIKLLSYHLKDFIFSLFRPTPEHYSWLVQPLWKTSEGPRGTSSPYRFVTTAEYCREKNTLTTSTHSSVTSSRYPSSLSSLLYPSMAVLWSITIAITLLWTFFYSTLFLASQILTLQH